MAVTAPATRVPDRANTREETPVTPDRIVPIVAQCGADPDAAAI